METTAFVTLLCTVTASLFGEFSCEYFVAGVEYQMYHDNGSFSSDAAFESNSCYFINIFEVHVKLSDVFIASGIPASVLSTSLFFLSLLYVPCCHTWLLWICQIFAFFSYETWNPFSHGEVSFMWGEIERHLARSAIPQGYRGAQRVISTTWWDVKFDLSFTISLPSLPSISEWRCLRNWYHMNLGIFSAGSFQALKAKRLRL